MSIQSQLNDLFEYAQFEATTLSVFMAFIFTANVACVQFAFGGNRRSIALPASCFAFDLAVAIYHLMSAAWVFPTLKEQHEKLIKAAGSQQALVFKFPFDDWALVVAFFTAAYIALTILWGYDLLSRRTG